MTIWKLYQINHESFRIEAQHANIKAISWKLSSDYGPKSWISKQSIRITKYKWWEIRYIHNAGQQSDHIKNIQSNLRKNSEQKFVEIPTTDDYCLKMSTTFREHKDAQVNEIERNHIQRLSMLKVNGKTGGVADVRTVLYCCFIEHWSGIT